MSKSSVTSFQITKFKEGNITSVNDLIAVEEPLEIRLGFGPLEEREQKNIAITMRTPGNDFELAIGFLFTEGIIASPKDILSIKYCTDLNTIENKENIVRIEIQPSVEVDFLKMQRNFYTTSSCGICGKASINAIRTISSFKPSNDTFIISNEFIVQLPNKLREHQHVFEYTGGLHACALFDENCKIKIVREDVGRHNALDKLIGAILEIDFLGIKNTTINLNRSVLLLSGRASFELLQKAAMAGIHIVCSVGAPSSLAVETAAEFGITLIGFLKQNSFNIYTEPQRIS